MKRRAFTTVELLIVIAVVAVLVGLLFIAARGIMNSSRERQTRGALQNLEGMLGEFRAIDGLRRQPSPRGLTDRGWLWWDGTTVIYPSEIAPASGPTAYVPDFWTQPYCIGNRNIAAGGIPDALVAPGNVSDATEPGRRERNGSIAIVNSCLAMNLILSVPANSSRMQSLPQNQRMVPTWSTGTLAMAGADLFTGTTDDGSGAVVYYPTVYVTHADVFYVALRNYIANGQPPTGWQPVNNRTVTALMLDAWGNPIIFVPGTGLRVRLLNSKNRLDPADPTQNWIIVSPDGEVVDNGSATTAPKVVRVGKPFFASAGPDGNFSTGDDNLYSFGE